MSTAAARAGVAPPARPHVARAAAPRRLVARRQVARRLVARLLTGAALAASVWVFGVDAWTLLGRWRLLDPSGWIRLGCAAVVAMTSGWLLLTSVGCAVARLPGRVGRAGAACARALAPVAVRRALALSLLASAAGPGVAQAATSTPAVAAAPAAPAAPADDGLPDPRLRPDAEPGREASPSVVVRPGDTLWDLAGTHLGTRATPQRIAGAWPRWYTANRPPVQDPDLIFPGQVLRIPTPDATSGDAR
ncbi:MAG: LysM peptidoglycan-binding domain-containing protein [Austwickia sp.]|jgi:hypothetical protein|nr:MAG: LysM peptidoglycan-binding domain-containing protein [Austwickia sp.]